MSFTLQYLSAYIGNIELSIWNLHGIRSKFMRTLAATEAIDIRTAGRQIGLGQRAAYRAAERGDLPAVKLAGRWVVPLQAWRRFLAGDWKPDPERHSHD